MSLNQFQAELLAWYDTHKRDLPWRRHIGDRYAVWVSETMLQQTTVTAVIPFFERWMARFPTVEVLACASIDEALSMWQGLGYYRRCRFLHAGAQWVMEHGWPADRAGWEQVPGVGNYTAGAILSIADNVSAVAVDGNVKRVYARLNDDGSAEPALTKGAWFWAEQVVSRDRPRDWTQALMELGATVCTPKSPLCDSCPVQGHCRAFAHGTVGLRPSPSAKVEKRNLHWDVMVCLSANRVAMRQIPEGEWWHGLWEFPRCQPEDFRSGLLGRVNTVVTNHAIRLDVYLLPESDLPSGYEWVGLDAIHELALSSPMRRVANMVAKAIS